MLTWWRDIIREALFEGQRTVAVQQGLRMSMILFIASEVVFFLRFLGHFLLLLWLLLLI